MDHTIIKKPKKRIRRIRHIRLIRLKRHIKIHFLSFRPPDGGRNPEILNQGSG